MRALPNLCPQCGFSPNAVQKSSDFPSPCKVPNISPFSPSDAKLHSPKDAESMLLCQEISRIDDAIHQLYEERASLCRRLNETQSFVANLPSNVLITIFEYVCPPSEYNSSHQRIRRPQDAKPLVLPIFALSAVSTRWRQILLFAPFFWSKLDWHWKYHLSPDDTSALLRTYFTRASPLKFDLKLTIDEKWEIENTIPYNNPDHVDGHLDALKQTIFYENCDRIGKLSLDAPIRWLHLLSNSFIHLSDLSLRSGRIDECIDLSHLHSLTRVTFMNIKATPVLPWKRISTIHLIYAHINVALDLLKRCPHLTSFHSHHPNPVKNGSITQTIKDPITLSHLKWLEWNCVGSLWDDALFRFMSFPNLKRLSLSGDVSWNLDWEQTLMAFLMRLPVDPPLNLELGYIRDYSGDPVPVLKTIFRALGSSLRDLTVLEDDHTFLEKLITLLIPSSSPYSSPSPPSSPSSPSSPSLSSLTSSTSSFFTSLNYRNKIYLPSLHTFSIHSASTRDLSSTANTLNHGASVFTRLRGAPPQSPAIIHGDLFVELLRQRRKVLHVQKFSLDLNLSTMCGCFGEWRKRCKEEVRKLIEEGFELEVLERGKRVEWL
ncbi:hypothetical protein D9756_002694 [Leucocoprinus leucothites]|uniref:F-box domain-containing protein n=1 Tax=Leucocoprinus leucothites TaxID=201217 RepID=A0A8H5GC29_9AGAR|nr:hypothetical protein D9756_002694 [Leucoagaricus leucothites]